jgi:hypothetical protein
MLRFLLRVRSKPFKVLPKEDQERKQRNNNNKSRIKIRNLLKAAEIFNVGNIHYLQTQFPLICRSETRCDGTCVVATLWHVMTAILSCDPPRSGVPQQSTVARPVKASLRLLWNTKSHFTVITTFRLQSLFGAHKSTLHSDALLSDSF